MRLVIRDTPSDVAIFVANYIRDRILLFNPTEERPFVIGLPTGSSPLLTYKKLIEYHKKGEISFRNVVTFNMVKKKEEVFAIKQKYFLLFILG